MRLAPRNPALLVAGLFAAAWIVLLPPLFTGGACTREFEAEAKRIEADRAALDSTAKARAYWIARGIEFQVLPVERCRRARLAFLERCGPGPLLYARVPTQDAICRIYRDDAITVQLHYNEKERLAAAQVDMKPFRSLPLPFDATLHWGR
jgi:hypothetical protein